MGPSDLRWRTGLEEGKDEAIQATLEAGSPKQSRLRRRSSANLKTTQIFTASILMRTPTLNYWTLDVAALPERAQCGQVG